MSIALNKFKRPLVVILGGQDLTINLVEFKKLLIDADRVILGGEISYAFLKAKGLSIGKTFINEENLQAAKEILQIAYEQRKYIYLPIDHIVAKEFLANAKSHQVVRGNIAEDEIAMDIGPMTIHKFSGLLKVAKTVFWSGAMGVSEFENFTKGTIAIAKIIEKLSNAEVFIKGEETVFAVSKVGYINKVKCI